MLIFSISIGRGSQEEDWRQSLSRMFSQNQRWRPRGVRTCHPCRAPVEERTRPQEIEMPDIVICQGRAVAWDFESWRSIALWQPRDGVSSICLDIRLRPGLANGGAFFYARLPSLWAASRRLCQCQSSTTYIICESGALKRDGQYDDNVWCVVACFVEDRIRQLTE